MQAAGVKARILNPRNRKIITVLVWIIASLLAFAMLVFPVAARPSSFILRAGDVAPQDIQAPYSLSFESQILTEQSRQDAEDRVQPIYLPADPAISRKQLELLRTTINYISIVRQDMYADENFKLADLGHLQAVQLDPELARSILNLNVMRWEAIQAEALKVLEQIMRETIRTDQTGEATRRIPTLISFTLPQDQASIVNDLVSPFVTANSLFDEEQTQAARQFAQQAVDPVIRNFVAGETIVRRGQVISLLNWEALQEYNLVRPKSTVEDYYAPFALVAVTSSFGLLFFHRRNHTTLHSLRSRILVVFLFLLFLFAARLIIPNRTIVPYFFPLPAFGLTVAVLFNLELGLVLSLMLSLLTGFGLSNSLDLTVFYIMSSFVGVLTLGKGQRISSFIWAGIALGTAGSAVLIAYRLTSPYTDLIGLVTLMIAAYGNGVASSSLSLLFQYIFSQLLGVTTALQLLEISRPDHPLLQFILRNAPGSYQHSLQVAVLAEQAAEKIGADAMLVRVGGLYHDAGKALNPSYFIENQIGIKINTHDDLDPAESARIIIDHVNNGVALARKYNLPVRIQDFMREHHGTLLTRYQYARALEAANNDAALVNDDDFRYPGPIPGSRETALLMLADGCQARVRAELPQTDEEIRAVIRKVVDYCEKSGQLDNTRLTIRDLRIITDSFVNTLRNTYHPRIRYPEISPKTKPTAGASSE